MKISKSPADPVVGQTLSLTVSDMVQIQQKRGAEPVETTVEWRFDPPDMVSEVEESEGKVTFKAKATGKVRVMAVATMVDPGTGAESTQTVYEDLTIEPHVGVVEGVYSAIRKIAEEGINVDAKPGSSTEDQALWVVIRDCVRRRSYENYAVFIDTVLCKKDTGKYERLTRQDDCSYIHGVQGYQLLKAATEVFLLCGSCCGDGLSITEFDAAQEENRLHRTSSLQEMQATLESYLSDKVTPNTLPYLRQILNALQLTPGDAGTFPFCPDDTRTFPCLFELIWSYWHEEGMLVQTMNGLSRRFRNHRTGIDHGNPLANFELDPLRPLNNLLWGYIQDATHQLDIRRRALEYDHEYGLRLSGKAVGGLDSADRRSKFLEAFHALVRQCGNFYKEDSNTWIVPDTFPLLQSLRSVHLILAEGAHNEFGDLPSTARMEMMIQQWLLAQRPMRDFLQSRAMVAYEEPWMGQVDAMKRLMDWTDVPTSHFHRLAVFGEQVLLSIRYGNWTDLNLTSANATNWAQYWKSEVQGYADSYRAVTGVDLMANTTVTQAVDATMPSVHLQRRLTQQSAGRRS